MDDETKRDVEVISQETLFKGYFRVDRYRLRHTSFRGGWSKVVERELFERGHAVSVLLYDPARDRVALLEQFRVGSFAAGFDPWEIEVVAGIIEEGETLDDVARREVAEEAGCACLDLVPIAEIIVSPGAVSETVAMYCARIDSQGIEGVHGLEAEGEDIRVFTLPADEAVSWVKQGRIKNSVAVISLLWLAGEREHLRARWM